MNEILEDSELEKLAAPLRALNDASLGWLLGRVLADRVFIPNFFFKDHLNKMAQTVAVAIGNADGMLDFSYFCNKNSWLMDEVGCLVQTALGDYYRHQLDDIEDEDNP